MDKQLVISQRKQCDIRLKPLCPTRHLGFFRLKKMVDVLNKTFGVLTVIKRVSVNEGTRKRAFLLCKCVCGNEKLVRRCGLLRAKKTSRCCCLRATKYSIDSKLFRLYKRAAARRKLSFSLSEEYFNSITNKNCHYCNKPPSNGRNVIYSGIDRKNNKIGYEEYNCVPCCKECNFLKGNFNYSEFIELIKVIHTNLTRQTSHLRVLSF